MLKRLLFTGLLALILGTVAACGTADDEDSGTGTEPAGDETTDDSGDDNAAAGEELTKLTMGFVPSQDAAEIADTVQPLSERLSEILGVEVEAQVMTDYTGLVEGMRTQQIDIGFLPAFGFVQAEERADVEVILKSIRDGESTYRAQFTVAADSELESIDDLVNTEDLVWAFADLTSTSGFLFPAYLFLENDVDNLDTHFVQQPVGGHDNALIAVLDGQADFATTYEDARERIADERPEAMDMKVIGFTDPIPNDTISLRSGFSEEWKQKIKDAFLSFNDDEDMIEVMMNVYNWTGIDEATSEEYQIVRDTYAEFQDLIE
nr:phosphate/phosphite/phosphonate ABC transporter substrate-binding protein [Evansella caseinilytica]